MPDLDPDVALSTIHDVLHALGVALDDVATGPVADLATRLDLLRRSQAVIKELIASVELTLIDSLEADVVDAGRWHIVREPMLRSTWKPSGAALMREDIRNAVASRYATDAETGEVNTGRRHLIEQVIDEVWHGVPSFDSIKADARKRWGLRMGDYRSYSDGYTVKVLPAVPQ